jgi:hypothetical protein
MRMSKKFAWRVLAAAVVLSLAPVMLATLGTRTDGPYGSALSLPAIGQVYAAAYCNDKYCAGGSRHNIVCAKVVGYHCTNLSGGYCSSNSCTP